MKVEHAGTVNNGGGTAYAFGKAGNRTGQQVSGVGIRVIVVPLNGFTLIRMN